VGGCQPTPSPERVSQIRDSARPYPGHNIVRSSIEQVWACEAEQIRVLKRSSVVGTFVSMLRLTMPRRLVCEHQKLGNAVDLEH
jgi:hypothetical protein